VGLAQDVARYAAAAIAPSTRKTYSQGERSYRSFCKTCNWEPLPASDSMLASFAAYMARTVKPGTILCYIAAVRNAHIECGFEDPTGNATLLSRVLKGIKRTHGTAAGTTRLPLTRSLIHCLVDQLGTDTSVHPTDRVMLRSAILLAFHGFLRCAEFVSGDHTPFDPRFDAARDSVAISWLSGQPTLEFRVKRSKTDPFAKGMTIYIGKARPPYCPVAAMIEYLASSSTSADGPLFRHATGAPLTRKFLTTKVRCLLLAAGVSNANSYSGHSFRIGAATTAAACGIPEWQIRAMGRWQSDCVLRYIRSNPSELARIAGALSNAPI